MNNSILFLLVFLFTFPKSFAASHRSNEAKILAVHVMNRLGYGPRPGDIEKMVKGGTLGIRQWILEQMKPENIDDSDVEAHLREYPVWDVEPKELHIKYDNKSMDPNAEKPNEMLRQLKSIKLTRAVESNRQLVEVLADFWFNHFNVNGTKGAVRWLLQDYEEKAIRPNLFGKFEDLLLHTARHPAMLFYLDNFSSKKGNLNENYAREVMELHTLGVQGGYTQNDVTELARILTGWGIVMPFKDPEFRFFANQHDEGLKTFMGKTVQGNGEREGEMILRELAHKPATARFITEKLIRAFLSEEIPFGLHQKLQNVFLNTKGNLRSVYEALFLSPEFLSLKFRHAKIKRPLAYIASSIRACSGEVVDGGRSAKVLTDLGEDLYKSVPPTGYPDANSRWINPGTMLVRLQWALDLVSQKVSGVVCGWNYGKPNQKTFLSDVEKWASDELNIQISDSTKEVLAKELRQEKHIFIGETVRPTLYFKLLGLTLGSPEFQRR